jgi:hypothetical protein
MAARVVMIVDRVRVLTAKRVRTKPRVVVVVVVVADVAVAARPASICRSKPSSRPMKVWR